jgi:hypothetical protein
MYWSTKTKRWVPDRKAPGNAPAANAAATNPTPVPAPVPNNLSGLAQPTPTEKVGRDLAISNASHQVNLAIQVLMNSFNN